ncbi:ComEA family DNA-binding protein [Halorhodospira neutriphila]|uniref:Competence protein ComEA helix-hairpin-helix repeat protein n=1 Tax=Halorhodospira neutriphila TaxID=168379 RepID=A0ABS1E5R7_9GAMM|nr:helix-hairpin-helix domain-containing protein [Halorhodospira neutriphila]MBK1726164.1 hypothetical protein [Halorhodospira neutriphila]
MSYRAPLTIPLLLGAALLAPAALAGEGVNINRAGPETLAEGLYGVGPVKAEAIIEDRQANGPFESAAGLTRVDGIGPKTLDRNEQRIVLEAPEAGQEPE